MVIGHPSAQNLFGRKTAQSRPIHPLKAKPVLPRDSFLPFENPRIIHDTANLPD
jgi:hypothetical protein